MQFSKYLIIIVVVVITQVSFPEDYPQFRGINRDGHSNEKNLQKKWPKSGPNLLWSAEGLGTGWSSPTIADGLIFITGMDKDKKGVLFAYDLRGKQKWKKHYGPEWTGSYPGSRTTPTVDKDRVYVISANGNLVCFEAKTGKKIWEVDVFKKYHGQKIFWGISESVLIYNDKVICTPGGKRGSVVALNKMTGQTIWTAREITEPGAYCSPILIKYGSKTILATMLKESAVGIDADNGKVLWTDPYKDYQKKPVMMNPVSPVYHDGAIYFTSGYNCGGTLLELSPDGSSVERKWIDLTMDTHHGGVVLVNGYLYGTSWTNVYDGDWVCVNFETGKVMYETSALSGKGSIIYADDMLYCYGEKEGEMALAQATPKGFNIISSFKIKQGTGQHWAHPAISDGILFIRHGNTMMAYDIKK